MAITAQTLDTNQTIIAQQILYLALSNGRGMGGLRLDYNEYPTHKCESKIL